jgi:hypothetical protein
LGSAAADDTPLPVKASIKVSIKALGAGGA